MPRAAIGGVDLYYTVDGPAGAPAVVLLHGLGSSADDWALQIPALAARYRVVAVDLPAHHRSGRPVGALSVPGMAATITALLDRLTLSRVHVIGLSLGACVALALAATSPERVQSLVLVNGFARLRPATPRAMVRGAARLVLLTVAPMAWVAAYVAREAFPRPEHRALREAARARIRSNPRRDYLAAIAALLRFDARRGLPGIGCPTLVVAGEDDTTVPLAAKSALAQAIPGARLVVVPRSGHVTPYDCPDALNALLLHHLASA